MAAARSLHDDERHVRVVEGLGLGLTLTLGSAKVGGLTVTLTLALALILVRFATLFRGLAGSKRQVNPNPNQCVLQAAELTLTITSVYYKR